MKPFLFCTVSTLTACAVITPASDPTPPELTIAMFDPSYQVIASSDPTLPVPRGCPPGMKAFIIDVEEYISRIEPAYFPPLDPNTFEDEFYFYGAADDEIKFQITAADPEGVFSMGAIAHAHDDTDARAYDFGTRGSSNLPSPMGDYESGPGTVSEYSVTSPFDPNLPDGPIYAHDLRITKGFVTQPDGTEVPTLEDVGILTIAPFSLAGGPVIYASAANSNSASTKVAVKVLPRSLCRSDTLQP